MLLTSCAGNEPTTASNSNPSPSLSGTISGAGASSQGSAQDAWIAAFQTANRGVTINYDPTGSGAGRGTFAAGGSSFAGSDSSLNADEIAAGFQSCTDDSGYIEVPAYISPIAVIFNVEGIDKLNIDAPTLAGIFKGAISSWDDPAIAALNPGMTFPSSAITAVHRSDDSGTTKNFTDYLHQNSPNVWDQKPSDTFPYQSGEAAQGTSGVVNAVTNGSNTIGYADASRAGSLGSAALKVGDKFVPYSPEAAAAVVAGSPAGITAGPTDLSINIDRKTTDSTHYPLVLVSYIITCNEFKDAKVAPIVKAYLKYITGIDGQKVAADAAGSAPLSSNLSDKVASVLDGIKQ